MTRLRRRTIAMLVALLVAASLYPAVSRSLGWIKDAHRLVLLAGKDCDAVSLNPYAGEGVLVSPAMAVWILGHMDYPYGQCTSAPRFPVVCDMPLITWTGRNLGLSGAGADARIQEILSILIARGEPVDRRHDGLAPIHEALLFDRPEYLRLLLEAGADPHVRIERPGTESDGLNAFQFLDLLERKKGRESAELQRLLARYRSSP